MPSSAGAITRTSAYMSMTSPLGPDVLIPTALVAEEAISEPFLCRIEMVSERQQIDPAEVLRRPLCVKLARELHPERHFHGVVRRFTAAGNVGRDMWAYRAEIVPMLWFLSQTEDCRIFQHRSVSEILKQLLDDAGVTNCDFRVYGAQALREFTVQYNETDLDFASRLMEEEGYFYFFEHSASAHTLVITDENVSFREIEKPTMHLRGPAMAALDGLNSWQLTNATAHGLIRLADYDPTAPSKVLDETSRTTTSVAGASARDVYHWPARTLETDVLDRRTRLRMAAAEAAARLVEGTGFHEGFVPGGKFALENDPFGGADAKSYAIQSVVHHATDNSWSNTAEPSGYRNSFTAFPAETPWREPLRHPRPLMAGIHSAVVIGAEGEEIYPDRLGRVKVRLRWDHRRDATAEGSCWVRVLQPWTGDNWGWQFLPRVGTEVGVTFMDGDPDRPVIVGGLFNGEDEPVFPLPDQKTRSGLRTRSTPKGSGTTFSELSFEDKKGDELVFLHAEKDSRIEVENDETSEIGRHRTVTVKTGNRSVTIQQGNDTLAVKQGDRSVAIDTGKHALKVMADRTVEVEQGNDSLTVKTGNQSVAVSLGDISMKADLGAVTIEAMQSIELKVGQSSIKIDPTGVTVQGLTISIQGQTQTSVKGLMTQLSGDAMTQISGGIVMIG